MNNTPSKVVEQMETADELGVMGLDSFLRHMAKALCELYHMDPDLPEYIVYDLTESLDRIKEEDGIEAAVAAQSLIYALEIYLRLEMASQR